MKYIDIYVTLIFIVKICFITSAIYLLYIKAKKPEDKKLIEDIKFWKERIEFLFITLMSILLIYLFNPRFNNQKIIDGEIKLLLYLFGFVILLTENWINFLQESPLFKKFQEILA